MKYEIQDIADALRGAREAKQLSQRDLSRVAGVPQAQISRIESNSVDLRLSSLIAIASALDLEIALVPRKAMPAVKSISRQSTQSTSVQSSSIHKELQLLQKAISNIQIGTPEIPQLDELRKAATSILSFHIEPRFLENLRSVRRTTERAQMTDNWKGLSDATEAMKILRNQIAHVVPLAAQRSASRPAYALDEEDDDA